jgi:hypothetical protein
VKRSTLKDELTRLRKWRVKPGPEVSIAPAVEEFAKRFAKQVKAVGGLEGALEELLPEELRGRVRFGKLTPGGVLVLAATDSAAAYELDQWQRAGGLAAMRQRCSTKILRAKIEVK